MQLSIGFSPCPNDTFIFDKMVNEKSLDHQFDFEVFMEDVEQLNQWAFEGKLDITKVSFHAFLHLRDTYELLDSGAALGRGVGPLLVTTKEKFEAINDLSSFLKNARIAIPGKYTTANLLLSLAFPEAKNKTAIIFSDIESKVLEGTFDAGLIIHENRFTYKEKGLEKLMDMGDWWETNMKAPIPLGCIIIKKSLPESKKTQVNELIKNSVQASWARYPELSEFVRCHAQEMSEDVMRKHINLYVNEYTSSLGAEGHRAFEVLFDKAKEVGLWV